MISEKFIEHYGEDSFLEILVAKLVFHQAVDLSDSEIERCLGGCVLAAKLIQACKELRHKISWQRVKEGQDRYIQECDQFK